MSDYVQVILAADTVYDELLTESFMHRALRLLQPCQACGDALPPFAGAPRALGWCTAVTSQCSGGLLRSGT